VFGDLLLPVRFLTKMVMLSSEGSEEAEECELIEEMLSRRIVEN
jgi:hypothetical protein